MILLDIKLHQHGNLQCSQRKTLLHAIITWSLPTIRNIHQLKQTAEPKPSVTSIDDDIPANIPTSFSQPVIVSQTDAKTPVMTEQCSRNGRLIKPPSRYANNFYS